jgi:hypothetical protein
MASLEGVHGRSQSQNESGGRRPRRPVSANVRWADEDLFVRARRIDIDGEDFAPQTI